MVSITKTQVTTYEITHIILDMMDFNECFRTIRKNYKYKGFSCFNCGREFQDEEKISVIFTKKGNKTVCRKCGQKLKEELDTKSE